MIDRNLCNFFSRITVSIRDLLSWVNFINVTSKKVDDVQDEDMDADATGPNRLDPEVAYVHGACMVFLDAMGSGNCAKFKYYWHDRGTCLKSFAIFFFSYNFFSRFTVNSSYLVLRSPANI